MANIGRAIQGHRHDAPPRTIRSRTERPAHQLEARASEASFFEAPRKEEMEDDRLRLIFTCCHPALPPEGKVALTLREVCGLTTEEIARAFLVTPATLAQRNEGTTPRHSRA